MMPELDGYKVAKWIRQNQPSVAIVIVTAYDELPSFEQQQLHVDGFIHKPINIDELLTQVQAILEKNEGKITIETKIANTARCNAREVQCLGLKTRHRANFTSKF